MKALDLIKNFYYPKLFTSDKIRLKERCFVWFSL